jgi:hypothetical protein
VKYVAEMGSRTSKYWFRHSKLDAEDIQSPVQHGDLYFILPQKKGNMFKKNLQNHSNRSRVMGS